MSAEQFVTALLDELAQRGSGQWAERDDALIVPVIANLPTLGTRFVGRDGFAERAAQPFPSPNILPQNGVKTKRMER